jgi:hypothetical protein
MDKEEKKRFLKSMGYGGAELRAAEGLKNDFPKRRKIHNNEVAVEDLKFVNNLMNPTIVQPTDKKEET